MEDSIFKDQEIFYHLWSRSQYYYLKEKSDIEIRLKDRMQYAFVRNTKENNKAFLEELEEKRYSNTRDLELFLRGLIANYVRKRAGENEYILEYYLDWLKQTKFLTQNASRYVYDWCCEYEAFIIDYYKNEIIKGEDPNSKFNPEKIKSKPLFKTEEIDTIFDLLKSFFEINQQSEFKRILETGENANKKLVFLDNGNRLADAFKQLYESNIITGCTKKELEYWVLENYQFKSNGLIKSFKSKYLNDIISTKKDMCQKPILNVIKDKTSKTSNNKLLIVRVL